MKTGNIPCPVCRRRMFTGDLICLSCKGRVRRVRADLLQKWDMRTESISDAMTQVQHDILACAIQQLPVLGRPLKKGSRS